MTRKKKSGGAEGGADAEEPAVPGAAPKASAKAEPKAKKPAAEAPPTPEPKAKAKSEPKAKAKSEPKAKAGAQPSSSESKTDPKAKAEAKAEPKAASGKAAAKAKAKAEAKPEPKAASGKAAAKAKASAKEAPAPAPSPPPQADEDGLQVVKSRRRKKKKAEEITDDKEWGGIETSGPGEEEFADQTRIKDGFDKKNNALLVVPWQALKSLPPLDKKPRDPQLLKEVQEQKKALERIISEIDNTQREVKITRPKNMNIGAIMQQMCDLKVMGSETFSESTRKQMRADCEAALSQAMAFQSFLSFQADVAQIKEKCEARINANELVAKSVKSRDNQRKLLSAIADAKGVKAEEIKEADVVSKPVELAAEVMALQFLYKRKYEKQYGVLIERPEGSKGGGKGEGKAPPKSFVVRGLKTEVSACIDAMKTLNLKEQKAVTGVTPKQASAIMGPQQANARKLEEDFKGVFVHRDSAQSPIMIYGPPKEVAACLKNVQDNLTEEPAKQEAVVMNIDKDFAKCLIGAKGATVTKLEGETGTTINVKGHQNKDDDGQATVRITGDKANQEKARSQINAFLGTLESCLVEAGSEAVSRLYDGSAPRKGKGKGKDKGSGKGDGEKGAPSNPKFAELWNTSGLTCLKKTGKQSGVQLVGDKTEVAKWKVILEECLKEAGTVAFTVRLSFEQGRLWNQDRLDSVKASSEAEKVQKASRGRDTVIEISGSDEQKEKAKTAIQEINDNLSSSETIEDVSEGSKRYLTGRGRDRLREVEQKHDVFVSVGRKDQTIKIVGEAGNVASAKKEMEELISSSAGITREIPIEWDEGRVVIGKSGSTVNQIRRDSGLDTMKVEEADEKKKVVLCGSEEACDAAEKMIKEALQKEKERAVERAARAESKGASKGKSKGAEEQQDKPPKPSKKEESSAKADGEAAPEADKRPADKKWSKPKPKADFDPSKASFPSLGGDADGKGGKKGNRQPNNSAWKTVEVEEEAPAAQKEAPAAQEEAPVADAAGDEASAAKEDENVEEAN